MKAVILAGGEGTRIRPLTLTRPKAMLPIGPRPIIDYVLNHLLKEGFKEAIVVAGYQSGQIINYLGDGSQFGMKLSYIVEPVGVFFGTAGALKLAEHHLKDTFLVAQADTITEISLTDALSFHRNHNGDATVVLTSVDDPAQFGAAVLGEGEEIKQFQEKPRLGEALSSLVSTGFYVLEPVVLDFIENEKWDFARDLFPHLMKLGKKLHGHKAKGFWVDVGMLEGFLRGMRWVLDRTAWEAPTTPRMIGGFVTTGSNVVIESDTQVVGPSFIDNGTLIGHRSRIGPHAIVKEGAKVGNDVVIERAVVLEGVSIGHGSTIRTSVIGETAKVATKVEIENSIIGQGCNIGDNVKVMGGSRIWPNVNIGIGERVEGVVAVPREKAFYFNVGYGKYTGTLASSLREFIEGLEQVPIASIQFHLERRDFERWVRETLGSYEIAEEIADLRKAKPKGEDYRRQLINVLNEWKTRIAKS